MVQAWTVYSISDGARSRRPRACVAAAARHAGSPTRTTTLHVQPAHPLSSRRAPNQRNIPRANFAAQAAARKGWAWRIDIRGWASNCL